MNLQEEKERIEKAQRILELIEEAHRRIGVRKALLNGFQGTFPPLRAEYNHQVNILIKVINRLNKYYIKTITW